MHAYDLAKLKAMCRRVARGPDETLVLLDGREVSWIPTSWSSRTGRAPSACTGVMGRTAAAITAGTRDVLFESAWFDPSVIAERTAIGLLTDASQRFERGFDPAGQERALERACELLSTMAGGEAGPAVWRIAGEVPQRSAVTLRATRSQASSAGHSRPRRSASDCVHWALS